MSRTHHPDCRVEVEAWADREAMIAEDAEVWIEGDSILVSYFDDDGIVVFEGRREEPGRFRLVARSRPWSATLSTSDADAARLSGCIEEAGASVAWTLHLGGA